MKIRLILPVAAGAIALAASSCTPWVEPNPPLPPGGDAAGRNLPPDPDEQRRIKAQREEAERQKQAAQNGIQDPAGRTDPAGGPDSGNSLPPLPKPDPEESKPKPASIPVARKVPGKPGMVFSPFNNKLIDVNGIPSGKLVADPTYPASEKKHFRVP